MRKSQKCGDRVRWIPPIRDKFQESHSRSEPKITDGPHRHFAISPRESTPHWKRCAAPAFGITFPNPTFSALTHGTPDTLARSTVTRNSSGTTDRIVFPGAATVISFPPSTKTIVLDTANAAAFPGTVSASNGTTGTNVVNYSQFSAGGTSAYITNKLPGAFRETIGINEITTDGDGNATITFPIAFAVHAILPIVVVSNGDATKTATEVHLIGSSNTGFQVNCPGRISDTYTVNWFARGVA